MKKRIILTLLIFIACIKFLMSQNDSLFKPLRLVGITSVMSGNKYRAINTGPNITLYYKNHEIGVGILFSGLSTDGHQNNTHALLFSYQYFLNLAFPVKMGICYMLSNQAYSFRSDYAFTDPSFPNGLRIHTIIETNTFFENYIGGCFRERLLKHIVIEQFIGLGLTKLTYTKDSDIIGGNVKDISNYFSGMLRLGIGYKF